MVSMKDLWQYKEMFTKYKQLDKKLKSLIIRAKEWTYMEGGEEKPQVVIDISWEMKLKDLKILRDFYLKTTVKIKSCLHFVIIKLKLSTKRYVKLVKWKI